jgi:hypothetical protein
MRHLRQLIAVYLALCFAFAGAVGISPVLHRLIEHGGHGRAHTHPRVLPLAAASPHSHPHHAGRDHYNDDGHSHTHVAKSEHGHHGHKAHSHESFALANTWHALGHWLADLAAEWPDSSGSEDVPQHRHDSLPQLLISGLVEQHIDVPPVQPNAAMCVVFLWRVETIFLVRGFDPQTASRPPPAFQS